MNKNRTEDENRRAIIDEAMSWLGTPYHHRGRVKGAGVDCGMLLLEVYEKCGLIPHVNPGYYPSDWALHRSAERYLGWVQQYGRQVSDPKPGDIALYQFGRCISHGGIVVDWPTVIHSYIGQGVRLEEAGQENLTAERLRGFYRLHCFED